MKIVKVAWKKYAALNLPLKATIWFTICNFALKGISFICMPLYTRLLPTDEYGRMSVLTSYETIFIILATFEVYLGAFQRGILKFKDDVRTFEQTIVFFSNCLTIFVLLFVFIIREPFESFTGVSMTLYGIMTLYFLGYAPYNCWLNKKRFDYDYKAAVIVTLSSALLANLLPILSVTLWGRTAFVKVASTLLISTAFYIPFWIRDFKPLNLIRKKERVKEYLIYVLKFQGPLVFHSLSYYILNQSDRVMIDKFSDSTKVAFYSVAYSLATVIMLVQNSMNQVLRPWRYKKLEAGRYEDVRKLSNSILVLVGGAIIIFMLIVPEIFKFLFTEQYYESIICIPPITMGVYFLFLYTIFVDVESYYDKTSYIAYVSTSCAVLNIILNYVGMKIFSYLVCAYTTLISYAVMALFHYVFMVKTCKARNVPQNPVDAKFIWGFTGGMLAIFVLINSVYQNIVFRYLILALMLVVALIKRNNIKAIVTNVRGK